MTAIHLISMVLVTLLASCYAESERELIVKLLNESGLDGRPLKNSSQPLAVNISFGLIEIQNFDQLGKELTVVGWTAMEWQDDYLQWDSSVNQGLASLVLSPKQIWTPDVALYNSISKPAPIHETRVHVTSNGRVTWANAFTYRVFCETTPEEDQPTCELRFASWSLDSSLLRLRSRLDRIDASTYVQHVEWELFKNRATHTERELPWANNRKTSEVTYQFTLKRRPRKDDEDDADKLSSAPKAKVATTLSVLALFTSFVASKHM